MALPETQKNNLSGDSMNKNTSKKTKKQTIVGEYKLLKTLEKGKFGVVKLGKHIVTEEKVAIKVIDKLQQKQRTLDEMLKEADIMKKLDHHNIIKVHEIIDTESTFYIIMEYASNGDLFSRLDCGRMDEIQFIKLCKLREDNHIHHEHKELKNPRAFYGPHKYVSVSEIFFDLVFVGL
jgi:serine/threonine protein kinase